MTVRNIIRNPKPLTGLDWFGGYQSTVEVVDGEVVQTVTGPGVGLGGGITFPAAPGETWTLSGSVRQTAGVLAGAALNIVYRDAATNVTGEFPATGSPSATGTRIATTYTAPPNTATGEVQLRLLNVTQGSVYRWSKLMLTQGPDVLPYFDGDTAPTLSPRGSTSARWEGAPDASASVLEPLVVGALDRLYGRLPDHYRDSDADLGFPLYRWLSGVLSQYDDLALLVAAVDYTPPTVGQPDTDTSILTDPQAAPIDWLPWLAQLVGVPLRADMSQEERRDAITYASSGWRAGTKAAVADAAKTALTGTKFAQVYDHTISDPGDGGQWDVLIITRLSETPDPGEVIAQINRRGAKPAGVVIRQRSFESAWQDITAAAPTWGDLEALGSWLAIEEVGLQ